MPINELWPSGAVCQACGNAELSHISGGTVCIQTCERNRKALAEYEAEVARWRSFVTAQPNGYIPVPVEAARQISQHCHKEIVVILAYDASFQTTHTTTYGYSPAAKDIAAVWGEQCNAAIGGDQDRSRIFEDFRATTEAENRRRIEDLTGNLNALEAMFGPVDRLFPVDLIEQWKLAQESPGGHPIYYVWLEQRVRELNEALAEFGRELPCGSHPRLESLGQPAKFTGGCGKLIIASEAIVCADCLAWFCSRDCAYRHFNSDHPGESHG